MKNDYAYLAGYIDGDGCFYIGKNIQPIKFRSGIIISSAKKDVLRDFKQNFGGNIIFGKKNTKFQNWAPVSQWYTGGENALKILDNIFPFLKEKIHDAKIMKSFILADSREQKEKLIQDIRNSRNELGLVTKENVALINQLTSTSNISDEDYAYLAGFIDSECSISLMRYRAKNKPNFIYKSLLQCNNTKVCSISYLKQKFGGFCYYVPRHEKNPKHRDQIAWRTCARNLANILPNLLPFLKTKKPICELLIQFNNTVMPLGGDRHTHLSTYLTTLELRDHIFHQIASLNSKSTL